MRRLLVNAGAGLVATAAMTAAMEAMFRMLPRYQRYPLPPRLITTRMLRRIGAPLGLRSHKDALTMLNHFGYGAVAGALHTPVTALRLHPLVEGALYGMAVWGGSYLGWLPKAGILPHPKHTPKKRTALMIVAHLVWGTTLATLAQAATGRLPPRRWARSRRGSGPLSRAELAPRGASRRRQTSSPR